MGTEEPASGARQAPPGQSSSRLELLGSLAAGLAHEIKNPLSTMTLNLQLLKEDWADAQSPRDKKTLAKIDVLQKEVKRLEEILNDFLRFARGPKLAVREADLNAVVEEMLDFVMPETVRQGVHVRCVLDDTLPPVRFDRNVFKQALLNVFLNAQQAMEGSGGELMVTTRREQSSVRIDVVDTGCGIPTQDLERIFQVYYSTKKTGTGLGLPTARRMIEDHDGAIEVASEVGRGTQVTIRLPIAGPNASRPEADAASPPDLQRGSARDAR